jgi:hypothetical protein
MPELNYLNVTVTGANTDFYNSTLFFVGSLCVLLSLCSISLLFFIFLTNRSLINNSVNMFILNLVFIDLIRALVHQPIFLYSVGFLSDASDLFARISNSTVASYDWHSFFFKINVLCGVNSFLNLVFEIAQMLSFVAISYERFNIVLSPMLNQAKRLGISRILLAVIWTVAICSTAILLVIVSFFSSFKNLSTTQIGCLVDIFHVNVRLVSPYSLIYNETETNSTADIYELDSIRTMQNKVLDLFHLTFTAVAFALSGYFYTRIILFIKFHEKNLFKKVGAKNAVDVGEEKHSR